MQVVVNSLLTTYQKLGQDHKPTLLIVHGWGDSSAGWLAFGKQLAWQYQVVVVDLPGFGRTDMPHDVWGLDEYAAFVAAFMKKINLTPFAIIGHSNGGAIAIRGLAQGVLHADKLILLASAGVRSEYKGRKRILRVVAKTGKALVMPLPDTIKQRLRRKLYTTVGSDMLVAEHLQETFKRVVGDDVQADAAQLNMPVLLVYGQNDIATPSVYGRLLHERIDGSTLEIIGDAEHFLHTDQPEKVLKIVEGFLS